MSGESSEHNNISEVKPIMAYVKHSQDCIEIVEELKLWVRFEERGRGLERGGGLLVLTRLKMTNIDPHQNHYARFNDGVCLTFV